MDEVAVEKKKANTPVLLRKRVVIPVVAVILLAIGLGVGLGVGLKKQQEAAAQNAPQCTTIDGQPVLLSQSLPSSASQPVAESFISFAFELSSFPSFAGNSSDPGEYSYNLLSNLGNLTGSLPYIRVGGNAADMVVFNDNVNGPVSGKRTGAPVPNGLSAVVEMGSDFFDSYSTWPDVRFIHDFNLQLAAVGDLDTWYQTLQSTVPLACKALSGGKLLYWEYGNEPNLYTSGQSYGSSNDPTVSKRGGWSNDAYVSDWQNGTAEIQRLLASTAGCEDMASGESYGFMAPSFWLPSSSALSLSDTWDAGLDSNGTVKLLSMHIYGGDGKDGGVTIANTMLNHTAVCSSVEPVINAYRSVHNDTKAPLVIGETNSLYNTGVKGITDTFSASLWSLNYILWCATQNITRIHLQQGVGFPYNSWQPVQNFNASMGTKPPYYGNLAAAAALGDSANSDIRVAPVSLDGSTDDDGSGDGPDVAYATYQNGTLARLAILNLREWNASSSTQRGEHQYSFKIPGGGGSASIQRLLGPGADSQEGISWDGSAYDLTPNKGLASSFSNVTTGEQFAVCNQTFSVTLEDSSAVVLNFHS